MTSNELKELKERLWHSADILRSGAHLAANKYGQPILGLIFLRYADVLLMRAEALIELNRHNEALALINQVRQRAKQSMSMIPYATNTDIALYQDGVNITWNQENARKALRWERRLEFAMEGSRF